jgi:hypothetical protein
MFAPVRARALKQLVYRAIGWASERERTRANAEPCHSCYASVGTETLLSQVHMGGGMRTHFPDGVAYRFVEVRGL